MSETRIYVVTDGTKKHLVDATSQSAAIRHVVKSIWAAKAVTPKELADLMKTGTQVEKALTTESTDQTGH